MVWAVWRISTNRLKYPNLHQVLRHREEFCQPAVKFFTFRSLDEVTTKWGKKYNVGTFENHRIPKRCHGFLVPKWTFLQHDGTVAYAIPPPKPQDVTRFPAALFVLVVTATWWDHWKTLQGSLNISSLSPPTSTQENRKFNRSLYRSCTASGAGRKEAVGVDYYLKLRRLV